MDVGLPTRRKPMFNMQPAAKTGPPLRCDIRLQAASSCAQQYRISLSTPPMASLRANCRKVVCIGRNYADHITELSSARPSRPFYFLKPPSSILLPQSGPVLRPSGVSLHYEVELGFVIGGGSSSSSSSAQPLKNLPDDPSTLGHIGAYFTAIDMTARNIQAEAKRKGLPWTIAKGFDTFLPVSRLIQPSQLPADPHAASVELFLTVNGVEGQRDSTALMLFRIPRLLSDISQVMALEPGDIVLTGTPKGVGEVRHGDVMAAGLCVDGKEIEEGRIEVSVQDAVGAEGGGFVYGET